MTQAMTLTQQAQQAQIAPQMAAGPYNPEPEALRNLMINYIPTTMDEAQLRQLFERFGPIESVKIVCDRETRQSRGYGFVKYQSATSAQQAINELNGYNILNKRLKVALAASGNQRQRQFNNNNGGGNANNGGMNYYGGNFGGYQAAPYTVAPNPYNAQQQAMTMPQQYMVQPSTQPQAQQMMRQ